MEIKRLPTLNQQHINQNVNMSGYVQAIHMPAGNRSTFHNLTYISQLDKQIDYTELIGPYNLNLMTIKSKKIKRKRFSPIEPDSNFKTTWDLTGLFLILYDAVVIPYRVSFNMQSMGFLAFFEYFIDVFFITDVRK